MTGAHTVSSSRAPRTIPFADSRSAVTTMSSLHRAEDAVVRARNLNAWPMSAVTVMAGICSPRDPVCGGHTPADRGCITEYCELLSVRFEAAERIKGLRDAKPPQKPGWTDSVGFGGS